MYKQKKGYEKDFSSRSFACLFARTTRLSSFFVGDEEPASSVFAAFFFDGLDPCCSP